MAKPGTEKLLGNLGGHQALRVLSFKLGDIASLHPELRSWVGEALGVLGNSFLSRVC